MVKITKYEEGIKVTMLGWHTLWCLKGEITILKANIIKVYAAPNTKLGWWHGWRMPGMHIPGFIVAGTYYYRKKKYFWDVVNVKNTIVLELKNFKYDELHIEVEDPQAAIQLIKDL